MVELENARLPHGASALIARSIEGPAKGIVLLPSMFGTTPAIKEMAGSLATDHGWTVCVPEIVTDDPTAAFAQRRQAVASLADEAIFETLADAATATRAQTVALIGFCVGGMYAMKATSLRLFDRVVAFYGMVRVPEYWRSPDQGEPMEYLRDNTDRILAIFGEQDEFIPRADIDAIAELGVRTLRYPDAGHAFAHDPGQGHYRPDDAADAWQHALSFISHGETVAS